jgi:filamentous hemagglutinin family protein
MTHIAAATLLALALALAGNAAPIGEEVMAGDVEFNRDGSVTLIRASDGAIINYDSFDIFAGEVVRFLQPSDQARVLNRVFGDATRIEGSLFANGIVYIVNPAGIFIDGNAVVEVGELVAAAGSITNEDFAAGIDRFALTGALVNEGVIEAGQVALLGQHVANHGQIQAPDGTIALVAGERVLLTQLGGKLIVEVDGLGPGAVSGEQAGVLQTGTVDAGAGRVVFAVGDHYSLAINHDGLTRGHEIELDGGDGLVRVAGMLDATSDDVGGTVHVLGDRVGLFDATVDASGDAGGGEIRIGGDVRGGGELRVASRTVVDAASELRADAREVGDGGSIVVWGDEAAVVAGNISARGGDLGGNGGFAEISSLGLLRSEGAVDLGAAQGERGTLLYDPQDILIQGGTADGSDDPDASATQLVGDDPDPDVALGAILAGDIGDGTDPFEIYESEIEGTDANIVLEARNSITTNGAFTNEVAGEGAGVLVITDGNSLAMSTSNETGADAGSANAPGIDLGTLAIRASGGGGVDIRTGTSGDEGVVADIAVGDITAPEGRVVLFTEVEGAILAGNVDTSGLDGDTGGSGGVLALVTSGDHALTAGSLSARGGNGAAGNGGQGGAIQALAGGDLVVGDTDSSGGDGTAQGGGAGNVDLQAEEVNTLVAGSVTARGGAGGTDRGGAGGRVQVFTADGNLSVGAIDSSGGAGMTGGNANSIPVDARRVEGGTGDATLEGTVTALAGAGADPDSDGMGAAVTLRAGGALDFAPGVTGPHIRIDAAGGASNTPLILDAATIGAAQTIEVDAGGDVADEASDFLGNRLFDTLQVEVDQSADVAVTNAGFNRIAVRARSTQASIDITQAPEKVGGNPVTIDIDGGAVNRIVRVDTTQVDLATDTVGSQVDFEYVLVDGLTDADDVDLGLEVASGAVTAGGTIAIRGEDGVTLEDDSIAMHELLDANGFDDAEVDIQTDTAGGLLVAADADEDGLGALLDQAGPSIDMNADGVSGAGTVTLLGGAGVGAAGNPLEFQNGNGLAAGSNEGSIHLRQTAGGDVQLFGILPTTFGTESALAVGTDGDIDFENAAGNVNILGSIRTSMDDMGNAGNIRLASPGGEIVFVAIGTSPDGETVATANDAEVVSEGSVVFEDPVRLFRNASVSSGEGVEFMNTIDSGPALRNLVVEGPGTTRLNADVGSDSRLRDFRVESDLVLAAIDDPMTPDVDEGDMSITVSRDVRFGGDVDADVADATSVTITAPSSVELGGNVGVGTRVSGLTIDSGSVRFTNDGVAQQVAAGDAGILINVAGRSVVPQTATIGKAEGDLSFTTPGAIDFGPNEKASAGGTLELVGASVRGGDFSAVDLIVDAPTIEIRTRAAGSVLRSDGGIVPDLGVDWIANTITTSSVPVVLTGGGAAPEAATLDGTVAGAGMGSIAVATLPRAITPGDLVNDGTPLDLSLPIADSGNEVPLRGLPVEPLREAQTSNNNATGTAEAPAADRVLDDLRCAAGATGTCPPPAPGSPLDTPRGEELRERYARLFGDSDAARRSRGLLAGDPSTAETGGALRDFATLLIQARLLGLGQGEYETFRDALLAEAGTPEQREALLAGVRRYGRGVAL